MSKRQLDDTAEGDQQSFKIVKLNKVEEKESSRDCSNGDETQLPTFSKSDFPEATDNNFEEFLNNDPEIVPESHSMPELAPAKRISKRSVKKNTKLKREKSLALAAADPADLIDDDPSSKNKRRTWERWSKEDTNIFFEGVSEFGKDFDKLQAHFKTKYRSKRGFPENYIKNKDQIRHFYYRTWHKISGHIKCKDLKNNSKELSGLINYGELWRKIGGTLDDKWGSKYGTKLDDMVQKGTATVKIKGKTLRLKTPVCRALKKTKEEELLKPKNKSKLPSKVIIELRPHTTSDWSRVQRAAQNPHVRVTLGVQRKLASVIKCLEKKWRSVDCKTRIGLSSNTHSESPEHSESTSLESGSNFVFLPPRGVTVKPKQNCCAKTDSHKLKRPKIKIKLTGFYSDSETASRDKDVCDVGDDNPSKFEEILSMQRKRVDTDNGIDDNSNEADELNCSPKPTDDHPKQDDNIDAFDEENDFLDESDHECSRSPIQNDYTADTNEDKDEEGSESEVKEEEEENKDEFDDVKFEDDEMKPDLDLECKGESADTAEFNPEDGWSLMTVGSMTIGELYSMMATDSGVARLRLDYSWRTQPRPELVTDMLSRLVKLASAAGRGRGRTTSTSSGGGSPSVRIASPLINGKQLAKVSNGGGLSPVGRGPGASGGAAKQIIMPGGNGVEQPGSPLAVPLDSAEHEFRRPLLPPAPIRQGAMSAAFKEQIGQYLPKWSNRPGRQRRSRVKQVVGRSLLQPSIQPRPGQQVVQVVGPAPVPLSVRQTQIVQVVPISIVDPVDPASISLIPATSEALPDTTTGENGHPSSEILSGAAAASQESPPQISIPSPSRRSPSPTPSFSSFMDMSFESVGQRTPTKSDTFLNVYDNENSLLETPTRPSPSPSPGFSHQDLSMSSWSLNFESPMKNLSLPLPFNEDSQSSTISTVSEVRTRTIIFLSDLKLIFLRRWTASSMP